MKRNSGSAKEVRERDREGVLKIHFHVSGMGLGWVRLYSLRTSTCTIVVLIDTQILLLLPAVLHKVSLKVRINSMHLEHFTATTYLDHERKGRVPALKKYFL